VALLKHVKGVGTLIALTFLLRLEDAHRFRKSRDVVLHLAGHTLSSDDCDGTKSIAGIDAITGLSNVQIDGGQVSGFNDGIALYSSNSRVRGVALGNACFFDIALSGTNNRVGTSIVSSNRMDG
jgi:hypothetical protein